MKVGVIFFHGNLFAIHPPEWSQKCINSIKNQTFKDFTTYEINFGDDDLQLVSGSLFYNVKCKNFADATNYIVTKAFDDGCDYVFNTNIDDTYHPERIEKQLHFLKSGYDVVSSDFCYMDEKDTVFHNMNIKRNGDIKLCLNRNLNVIAHPCVAYSKKFWQDPQNRYDINKIGTEDLELWKSAINRGYNFYIHDDILLYYRIHGNKASANPKVGLNR